MEISLATVTFEYHDLLYNNLSLLADKNKDVFFNVFVANNSEFPHKFTNKNIKYFRVDGVDRRTAMMRIEDGFSRREAGGIKSGLHHGAALDKAIKAAENYGLKYLIVMDQDFIFLESIKSIIELMEKEHFDILGAPYSWGNWHKEQDKFVIPNHSFVPSHFFTIINTHIIKNVKQDLRQRNKMYRIERLDTGLAFRERIYNHKYRTFTTCILDKCNICQSFLPNCIDPDELGIFYERFYFRNKLVGLHFHCKNKKQHGYPGPKLTKVLPELYQVPTRVYHPLNNFILPDEKTSGGPNDFGKFDSARFKP